MAWLSHLDDDHAGGLEDVLDRVQVERIHASAHVQRPDRLTELQQVAGGVPVTPFAAPVPAYSGDGLTLDTLWLDPQDGLSGSNPNEGSLALAARWRDGATALLPGDIEAARQDRLADSLGPRPGYDVVLVPQHRSGYHDAELPQGLGPAVALVSMRAFNRYGHPVPGVLRGYRDAGAQVWRTGRHGTLTLSWTEDRVVVDRW